MTALVEVLRLTAFILALYNAWWSKCGMIALAKGKPTPLSRYDVIVFSMSVVAISFQLNHWTSHFLGRGEGYESWKMLSFLFLVNALAQSAVGRWSGRLKRLEELATLYACFSQALAMRDLYRIAPHEADDVANDCRRRIAQKLVVL